MTNVSFKGIALSSGGSTGAGYGGLIKYLEERGIYQKLEYFCGSSVGSLLATFMACRVSSKDIIQIMKDLDFSKFNDGSWFILSDIYRLYKHLGWNPGVILTKEIDKLLTTWAGKNITFKQIQEKYGSFLIITSTDMGYGCTRYYNPIDTPNMKLIDAIRESCSIPGDFCPVIRDDNIFIDGSVLDEYPIEHLYKYLKKEEVFGAKLMSTQELSQRKKKTKNVPKDFKEYLLAILNLYRKKLLNVHVKPDDWNRTVLIDTEDISAIDMNLTLNQKEKLIEHGYNATKKFFEKTK